MHNKIFIIIFAKSIKDRNIMLDKNLKLYLFERWKRDNLPRYLKYFEEWVNNITDIQIYYFMLDFEKSKIS